MLQFDPNRRMLHSNRADQMYSKSERFGLAVDIDNDESLKFACVKAFLALTNLDPFPPSAIKMANLADKTS